MPITQPVWSFQRRQRPRWQPCLTLAATLIIATAQAAFSQTVSTTFDGVNHPIRLEFWDASSGSFDWNGRNLAPTRNWTASEMAAIERGMQYWWDVLGDANTPGRNINLRVVHWEVDDDGQPFINAESFNANTTNAGQRFTMVQRIWADGGNPLAPVASDGQSLDAVLIFGAFPWTVETNGQLSPGGTSMEAVMMHELAHSLGYYATAANVGGDWRFGVDANGNPLGLTLYESLLEYADGTPLAVGDVYTPETVLWYAGPNAVALYGDRIKVTNVTHLAVDPLLMTHELYRNYPFFTELELAVLQDLGYQIDRSEFFGKSYYRDGTVETNTLGFNSSKTYGVGLHLKANNLNILQTGDLNANGVAGAGIRIDGHNNRLTIGAGTTVNANNDLGVGLLVSNGSNNVIVHRGTINANATTANQAGVGMLFSFGNNALGLDRLLTDPNDPRYARVRRDSGSVGSYLVDQVDISGAISAGGNAIEIAPTAAVREINILNGASLNGDIVSNAFTNEDLARPTITFGRLADDSGSATADADANFHIDYAGNIGGATLMDAQFVGGADHATGTQLRGATAFHSATIGAQGRLTADGELTTADTFTNNGRLTVTSAGTVESDGVFTNTGVVESNAGLISGRAIVNDGEIADNTGTVRALEDLDVHSTGSIENRGGTLESQFGSVHVRGVVTSDGGQINASQSVEVFDGGRLSGTPTIDALFVDNHSGGVIAPGNSIGTMTIVGEAFQNNGTVEYEISHQNLPQDADLIRVQGGVAVINNATTYANRGTFTFEGENSTAAADYEIARRYTILETDAPGALIVVQRPKTTDNMDDRRIILRSNTDLAGLYTPHAQIYYAYLGRDVPYASLGTTPNEQAIGAYLDGFLSFDDGSELGNQIQWLRDTLDLIPEESDVQAAFQMLSGEIYAAVNPLVLQEVYASQGRLAARLRNADSRISFCDELGYRDTVGWTGWVSGTGMSGQTHRSTSGFGYDMHSGGTQAVVGYGLSCQTMVGGFYEFSNLSFDNSIAGSAHTDLNEWGMFLSHHADIAHVLLIGSGGSVDNKIRRDIRFGNTAIQLPIQDRLAGRYDGSFANVYGEAGLRLSQDWLTVRPFLGLAYTHVNQDNFVEEGGPLALRVQDASVESLRSLVGLDTNIYLAPLGAASLDFRSLWMHDFLFDGVDTIVAGLDAMPGGAFTVTGTDIGRDFAVLGASLSFDIIPDRVRLAGGYDLIVNGDLTMNVGSGTLEMVW